MGKGRGKGRHGGGGSPGKDEEGYIQPPDGGWGWVVVLSSFLIHVIADGIVYSFGVFLPVFVHTFNSGRGETSWVGSLQPAVTFTVGPLASALTNRYGCRPVTIAGALICAFGFCISVVAKNLYFLYFSSGILAGLGFGLIYLPAIVSVAQYFEKRRSFATGLGFGLIYLPAIVSVAQYFEKRRSFATGIAVCGSGVGTFVFAPITEKLLEEFGWKGSMLILGGVILNVVACGGVMRPLEGEVLDIEDEDEEEEEEDNVNTIEASKPKDKGKGDSKTSLPETEALLSNGDSRPDDSNVTSPQNEVTSPQPIIIKVEDITDAPRGKGKSVLPAYLTKGLHFHSQNQLPPPSSNGLAPQQNVAAIAASDGALHRRENGTAAHQRRVHGFARQVSASAATSTALRPVGRKDVFYTASLQHIPMYLSHHDAYITSITSLPDAERSEGGEEKGKICGFTVPAEFAEAIHQMMDFSLLKNPVFLLFAISNFFTSIGFNMPFMYLPDRAILSGISESRAAWLLSAIGISNTFGRVVFGFMADLKWVNRLMLYNTALIICGVATALSPVVGGNYELLMTYAAIFGLFIGVYVSLTSVVLVDLLGIELLTNSFGLLLLFQGAATFIGPPLAGWMCDWTGSYDISFIVMGSLIAVSGAMLYMLPCIQRRYEVRAPQEEILHRLDMGAISSNTDIHRNKEEGVQLRARKTSL